MRNHIFYLMLLGWAATYGQLVTSIQRENSAITVIMFSYDIGSVHDPVGKEGLTHLMTQMIRSSASLGLHRDVMDSLEDFYAIKYDILVDKEMTTFTVEVPTRFTQAAYDLVKMQLLDPVFDNQELVSQKRRAVVRIRQTILGGSTENLSKLILEDALFRSTRYSHPTVGTLGGIEAVQLEDLKRHYVEVFSKASLRIGLSAHRTETIAHQIKSDFRKYADHDRKVFKITVPERSDHQLILVTRPGLATVSLSAGFHLSVNRSHGDYFGLLVANSWLGEHRRPYGKLTKETREYRGMNYGTFSYIEWLEGAVMNSLPVPCVGRSHNYFSLWIRPVQTASTLMSQYNELEGLTYGQGPHALVIAMHELKQLVKAGMTKSDFDATRDFLINYSKLYVEKRAPELGYLLDSRFFGSHDIIKEMEERLSSLKVEDVNQLIPRHLGSKGMTVVMVTSPEEALLLKKFYESGETLKTQYPSVQQSYLSADVQRQDMVLEGFPVKFGSIIVKSFDEYFN